MSSPLALYIHWPFCKAKCPYCDFNSHVRENIDVEQWLKAYLAEINYFSNYIENRKIGSIFFGGGTPSLMAPEITASIIGRLSELGYVDDSTEITLEANPTSIEMKKFEQFKQAGVNRVSIGIQALNDHDLKFLGREHSAGEAQDALMMAREIFKRHSFDLIYARPAQTVYDWQKELEQALELAGEHLSLYQLTIERGTPFYKQYQKKQFSLPGENAAVELFELTQGIMKGAGLPAYEISNHAKPGEESRHNLTYWQYGEYLGIGPGAHSRVKCTDSVYYQEIVMTSSPEGWLQQVKSRGCGIQRQSSLTMRQMQEEMIMMGLRLTDGIRFAEFHQLTKQNLLEVLNQPKLVALLEQKLINYDQHTIKATSAGSLVLNRVLAELLS